MITEDRHLHSTFSDGKSTPEEICEEALRRGMTVLGFSDHSYSSQDAEGTMPPERYEAYRQEIKRLKLKYHGRLQVLCGIEQDLDTTIPAEGFDYVIGSVHFLQVKGQWISVDYTPQMLKNAVETLYEGDPYALCEHYFSRVADLKDLSCDIIGHFDLVTKFQEKCPLFDPAHPRYIAAWHKAADVLLKTGRIFEINTGAISRGWRTHPYPAQDILDYLRKNGAKLILSSDSHNKATLMWQFDTWEKLLTL